VGDRFHSSLQSKLKSPSKYGWTQRLDDGRQLIGTTAVVDQFAETDQSQTLETREGNDEVENFQSRKVEQNDAEGFDKR
jgi:hypothetical protein